MKKYSLFFQQICVRYFAWESVNCAKIAILVGHALYPVLACLRIVGMEEIIVRRNRVILKSYLSSISFFTFIRNDHELNI